jgi:hypothetical protein
VSTASGERAPAIVEEWFAARPTRRRCARPGIELPRLGSGLMTLSASVCGLAAVVGDWLLDPSDASRAKFRAAHRVYLTLADYSPRSGDLFD